MLLRFHMSTYLETSSCRLSSMATLQYKYPSTRRNLGKQDQGESCFTEDSHIRPSSSMLVSFLQAGGDLARPTPHSLPSVRQRSQLAGVYITTFAAFLFRRSCLLLCGRLSCFYCPDSCSCITPLMHAPTSTPAAKAYSAAQQQHAPAPSPAQQWPQQDVPEMRTHLPWRRSACDRCRSQKLRCVRAKEDDTSRPCTRCLRIRYPCFTSLAKPPGRHSTRLHPPASASKASSGSDTVPTAPRPSSNRAEKTTRRRRPSEDVSLAPGQTLPVLLEEWPFSQDENQNEEAGRAFEDGGDSSMLTPSDEYESINFLDFLVGNNSGGFEPVTSVPPDDGHLSPTSHSRFRSSVSQALPQSLTSFDFTSPPSGFHFLQDLEDEQHEGAVHDMVVQDQISMPSRTPTPPVHCSPPGVLLASLFESLSALLVRVNTEPWDLGVLSVTGLTMDSGEIDVTATEALANEASVFNPLLSILVKTSKFLDICKLFMPPRCSRGTDEESSATTVAAGSTSHSGPRKRVFSSSGHEIGGSRCTQGMAKRTARQPAALSSLPSPFSLPGSTRTPSSVSSSLNRADEPCPLFPALAETPPTGRAIITAAQLLTVVSCYLQVVTIYNNIFSHLLFQLTLPPQEPLPSDTQHPAAIGTIPTGTNTPTSRRQQHSQHTQQAQQLATHGSGDVAPMVPNLVLAGYSVPLNAALRMRLLVEVVEHQFEQIEHALGLPGQYCVLTSHQQQQSQHHVDTSEGGLLAGREVTALLVAVMRLSIGTESGDADADSNYGRGSIGVVASLRENLAKAQRVRRRWS
ncbi:hypothetical protein LX36DRAFT_109200 [Colletotrichum falcatum]|nr:hypothetical protein LX36DRAFT_109200 [Colletotrichum falcatum]